MNERKILLVEDDFLNRRLTKKVLLQNGFTVFEAKNSKEALLLLNEKAVDLIILDINLGENEQNGIELSHQIRETFHTPFIFLTAYENPEIISRALVSTPYSYLTKPFKNTDLITSIELALRKSTHAQITATMITVKDQDFKKDLSADEIFYIASEGNYLLVHTYHQVYKIRSTLKQFQEQLPSDIVIQVHRAFIINKSKIEKYNNKQLIIKDTVIPLSKNYPFVPE
ncbi:MAG: DNA-binding response regulator [Saprospiraceae bacterium]|nr:DNA-binding response regulator [Candidatus Parvibacillus calidus]